MIWLLGALGWLRKAVGALLALVVRYPWQVALVASLCLSVCIWHAKHHAEAQRDQWHRAHDLRVQLEERAEAEQRTMNAAHVAKAKEAAEHADDTHEVQTDRNRLAARAWTDANRVRPGACSTSNGNPAPADRSAGVPEEAAPGSDLVAIPSSDMNVMADNLSYAQACYAYGQELVAKGVAR